MRKLTSILVSLAWLALGSGLLAHLHALQHRDELTPLHHEDAKCQLCAQCHTPAVAADTTAGVVPDAPPVGILSLLTSTAELSDATSPQTCRGPPIA